MSDIQPGTYSKINIYPVIYLKNTDGTFVLDTDGNKIVDINYPNISINDDYTIVTKIQIGE